MLNLFAVGNLYNQIGDKKMQKNHIVKLWLLILSSLEYCKFIYNLFDEGSYNEAIPYWKKPLKKLQTILL
jgi:hypothetical protein